MAVPQTRTVLRGCLSPSRGIAMLETMHDDDSARDTEEVQLTGRSRTNVHRREGGPIVVRGRRSLDANHPQPAATLRPNRVSWLAACGGLGIRRVGARNAHLHRRRGQQLRPMDRRGRGRSRWPASSLARVNRFLPASARRCVVPVARPSPGWFGNACYRALRHGPWNLVARAGLPIALIDWEFAGPLTPWSSWLRHVGSTPSSTMTSSPSAIPWRWSPGRTCRSAPVTGASSVLRDERSSCSRPREKLRVDLRAETSARHGNSSEGGKIVSRGEEQRGIVHT
jgi:hypothetical protein